MVELLVFAQQAQATGVYGLHRCTGGYRRFGRHSQRAEGLSGLPEMATKMTQTACMEAALQGI